MRRQLVAVIQASQDREAALRTALLNCREATLKEAGCECYDLFRDANDCGKFVLIELWESDAHLDDHMRTPHFEKLGNILKDLQAMVTIAKLDPVTA